ncbi:MAG: glutamate--tRNA ligase [Synergistaceae bacterium]|nr:glutamate--tRNA ligase [Synergistaceae bacterium]
MEAPARVRFAPSPTGALHIGGAHTALFNWLWARHTGGTFVLRIEDTDLQRSTKEFEETILAGLKWLGLDWDEGPDVGGPCGNYRQSERLALYRQNAEKLLDEGKAYKDGDAIVYRVPHGIEISFEDVVYGRVSVMSETLKDIVLMKSDGMPTYNYAVVVDDATMGINMVIRGEDHISNTPKQLLLYDALGFERPRFGHLPMILGTDKKKLSKRHGATSVYEYLDMGYLPDAVFNFLALLGWCPRDGREIFSREDAVKLFEIQKVTKRAAVFDMDKLNFINQEHVKALEKRKRLELTMPFWKELGFPVGDHADEYLAEALELMEGRGQTLRKMAEYSDYFLSFEPVKARFDGSSLDEGKKTALRDFYRKMLQIDPWKAEAMESLAREWGKAEGISLKDLAMPLRLMLTGGKVSPGIFHVAELLGRKEVQARLSYYGMA